MMCPTHSPSNMTFFNKQTWRHVANNIFTHISYSYTNTHKSNITLVLSSTSISLYASPSPWQLVVLSSSARWPPDWLAFHLTIFKPSACLTVLNVHPNTTGLWILHCDFKAERPHSSSEQVREDKVTLNTPQTTG